MDQDLRDQTVRTPIALSTFELQEAVELARKSGPESLAKGYVPQAGDPQRLPVLLAIIRADLGAGHAVNRHRMIEYQRAFPDLTHDSQARRAIAALQEAEPDFATPIPAQWLKPASAGQLKAPSRGPASGRSNQAAAPAVGSSGLELTPEVAEQLGFTSLIQLGKGGFGSVYLAQQPALNCRQVAIKYTALPSRESQVLAALHHPNIVPVLSVHEYQGARVFCMPYHGKHTLADVLQDISRSNSLPATGAGFLSASSPPKSAPAALAVAPKPETVYAEDVESDDQWGYYETDRQRLNRLSYVDSVVMGMTRLADALAHAHCRRVIHLDIKPANILITDDGVFMILDFGLAHHDGIGPSCESGGTIRYMAPEQLTQFVSGSVKPDVRMDLYSLGLVFYELLTGRHPFAASMSADVPMHKRIAARQQMPPSVRAFNPSVPPAVESIVLHLLHPDRMKRYQSAEHLLVDLTRHQQNLALKYAPNPSVWERVAKFRRRHPVFAVAIMALLLGVIALAAIGIADRRAKDAAAHRAKLESAEAFAQLEQLVIDQVGIRIDAGSLERQASRAEAVAGVEKWWDRYDVERDEHWQSRPAFARLPAEEQSVLTSLLAEQALLAAHAERVNAFGQPADVANAAIDRAVNWNRRAEQLLGDRPLPPVLLEQRTDLARLRGDPAPPDRSDELAEESNLDLYLRGLAFISERNYEKAAVDLKRLVTSEPHHAAGQFALGAVYQTIGRYEEAIVQYRVAKALAKTDPRPAYNCGALLVPKRQYDAALDDLNTALNRDPELVEGYYQRALVQYLRYSPEPDRENVIQLALDDINHAIRIGGESYRYLSLRQMIYSRMGRVAEATADLARMSAIPFRDERDHFERASRVNRTLKPMSKMVVAAMRKWTPAPAPQAVAEVRQRLLNAARDDFRWAVARNPLFSQGWQGLSAMESELGMTEQAIESLRRTIELLPGQTQLRFDRAVLLARSKRRNEAVMQIQGVMPADAYMWYQKACVYAHTADVNLIDRDEAVNALITAINNGFNDFDLLEQDEDLEKVRDSQEVQQLVNAKKNPVQ